MKKYFRRLLGRLLAKFGFPSTMLETVVLPNRIIPVVDANFSIVGQVRQTLPILWLLMNNPDFTNGDVVAIRHFDEKSPTKPSYILFNRRTDRFLSAEVPYCLFLNSKQGTPFSLVFEEPLSFGKECRVTYDEFLLLKTRL